MKKYKLKVGCKNCGHIEIIEIGFGLDVDDPPTGLFIYKDDETGKRWFYELSGKECQKAQYLICSNCGSRYLKKIVGKNNE